MTVHDISITSGVREVEPEHGWRVFEPAPAALVECSCGWAENVLRRDARATSERHLEEMQ